MQYLDSLGINYQKEFILPNLARKRFDFMFEYNNIKYLLEFDGEQHFKYMNIFYDSESEFYHRQNIDIIENGKRYRSRVFRN